MKPRATSRLRRFAPVALLPASLLLCASLTGAPGDQPVAGPVARIEGDDITIRGQMNMERETGHTFAELSSGSEVTVRSRQARIELAGGGEIGVCGPAKFSLLRSGATLTLALDFGRIHARLNHAQPVTIYTPLAVATPVSITPGEDELHLGLAETGQMCLYAVRGAVRVQPQFGEGAVLVPQKMEASFSEGHLEEVSATPTSCRCNALEAFIDPPALAVRSETSTQTGLGDHVLPSATTAMKPDSAAGSAPLAAASAPPTLVPAPRSVTPEPLASGAAPAAATPPIDVRATDEPVWKVIMPPLRFDAAASLAPPPKPETILLLREARVQSGAVFRGTVSAAAAPVPPAPPSVKESTPATPSESEETKATFGTRVRNFFRRLFGGKPKSSRG